MFDEVAPELRSLIRRDPGGCLKAVAPASSAASRELRKRPEKPGSDCVDTSLPLGRVARC